MYVCMYINIYLIYKYVLNYSLNKSRSDFLQVTRGYLTNLAFNF